MSYVRERIDPAFTILRVDAWAFPSLGLPSIAALRALPREPFGFDLRVTVPADQVVAAGGTLRSRAAHNNRVTYEYAGSRVPFLNISIAPFVREERGGVQVFALPSDGAFALPVLESTSRSLALLERWFGPLPGPLSLTIIEIPEGYGSQASLTGGIILEASAFRNPASRHELYHELSHLWNIDDREVPSARWNEGLATWLEYRLAEEVDGFTGRDAALERARVRVCEAVAKNGAPARVPFEHYGTEGTTNWSYSVGFQMFSALEQFIGTAALDTGLAAYLREFRTSGGSLRDLATTLDKAVPQDLRSFFDDWFFTTGWTKALCASRQ